MPYITGARLKVQRAAKHLHELERKAEAFLSRHPHALERRVDNTDPGYLIYTIPPVPAPPPTFGPVLGDVVHNLRSALDHVAWNLALLNLSGTRKRPYESTAFPILRNTSNSSIKWFYKVLQDVAPAGITVIEDLQPHHPSITHVPHPLIVLDELWNGDKHRVNTSIPARQYVPQFTGDDNGAWVRVLGDGTRLIRVPATSHPQTNLEPNIRMEVMFEIPDTGQRVSLSVLHVMQRYVQRDVIPRFAHLLPEARGIVDREHNIHRP